MNTNKPDWNDAPQWAQWLAQDENGRWYWFEDEPELRAVSFWPRTDFTGFRPASPIGDIDGDWRGTLEQRPQSSASDRQAARRARLAHGGLFKRRDFYVHPDDEKQLRELEDLLRSRRLLKHTRGA